MMRYEVGEENDVYIYIYDNKRKMNAVEVYGGRDLTREDAEKIAALLNDKGGVKHNLVREHLTEILDALLYKAERLEFNAGDEATEIRAIIKELETA